jgi:hypothetical protein
MACPSGVSAKISMATLAAVVAISHALARVESRRRSAAQAATPTIASGVATTTPNAATQKPAMPNSAAGTRASQLLLCWISDSAVSRHRYDSGPAIRYEGSR